MSLKFSGYGWMNNLSPCLKAVYVFPPVVGSWPHMTLVQEPPSCRGGAQAGTSPSPQITALAPQRGQLRAEDGDGEKWEWDEETCALAFAQLYVAMVLHTRLVLILQCEMFSVVSCGLAAGGTEHNVLSAVQQTDPVFRLQAGFYP